MPLSTLYIHRSDIDKLGVDTEKTIHDYCGTALEYTINVLDVPDREDAERRVIILEGEYVPPRSVISFTVGPNEYDYIPEIEDPSFRPTKVEMQSAADAIQRDSQESQLIKVHSTTIEAWANTTFVMPTKDSYEVSKEESKLTEEEGANIQQSRIKIVVAPGFSANMRSSGEHEPTSENEQLKSLSLAIQEYAKETLSLSESHSCEVEFVEAFLADADLSMEFDCDAGEFIIPEDVRKCFANKITTKLIEEGIVDETTEEGQVELWIRQGSPEQIKNRAY
jgi:hypothetical protein